MPGAKTHDAITLVTGMVLAPVLYVAILKQTDMASIAVRETFLFFGAHLLSGMMFSPDLDLDSEIDDRWGVFFWIWRPYMWAVPHRHRILSHGLVISSLLRLLYFYVVVMLLLFASTWVLAQIGIVLPDYPRRLTSLLLELWSNYPREVRAFLFGFITGGAVHVLADWLVTGGKRYLRAVGIEIRTDYRSHDHWSPRSRRRSPRAYR